MRIDLSWNGDTGTLKKMFLLVAFVVAVAPSMSQVKYSVSGTYLESGKKVYLTDQLTDQAIDSMVVADGKFSFEGTAQQDALLGVKVEGKKWTTEFFNDGTPVVINVNDSTLKGSSTNERLAKMEVDFEKPNTAFQAKMARMSEKEVNDHLEELYGEYNNILDEQMAFANKVFEEERHSLIPVAFSFFYFFDHGVETYDELVKEQVVFANHPYLKKMRDDVEKALKELNPNEDIKSAFIGQQYTDLEMAAPDGKMHKISELVGDGRWVLVDFWASWCGPCRAEMPNVLEAYNKYHGKGFEVIGISFDDKKAAWLKAVEQLQMPWLQLSDLKGFNCAAAPIYKIDAIPDNILINPQGKIVGRALRGKALMSCLQKIFGE